MKIEFWFKGGSTCDTPAARLGTYSEPGSGPWHCLMMKMPWTEGDTHCERTARIIERLFPGRACHCQYVSTSARLVHFNNHPETTREDVDKVLLAYTEELESAGG